MRLLVRLRGISENMVYMSRLHVRGSCSGVVGSLSRLSVPRILKGVIVELFGFYLG